MADPQGAQITSSLMEQDIPEPVDPLNPKPAEPPNLQGSSPAFNQAPLTPAAESTPVIEETQENIAPESEYQSIQQQSNQAREEAGLPPMRYGLTEGTPRQMSMQRYTTLVDNAVKRANEMGLDPNEEAERIHNAVFMADKMNMDVGHVYQNLDAYQEAYYKETVDTMTAGRAIRDEFRVAKDSNKMAWLGIQLMHDPGNEMLQKRWKAISDSMPVSSLEDQPLWAKALGYAGSFLPSMGGTAMAGLAGGVIAGVPGAAATSFLYASQLTSGSIFSDILSYTDDEGQTPFDVFETDQDALTAASAIASTGGLLSGAMEVLQVSTLGIGTPITETLQQITQKSIIKLLKKEVTENGGMVAMGKFIARYGSNVSQEVVQEVVQTGIEKGSQELINEVLNEAANLGIPAATAQEWLDELVETAKVTALGTGVLSLPGSIRDGSPVRTQQKAETIRRNAEKATQNGDDAVNARNIMGVADVIAKIYETGVNLSEPQAEAIGGVLQSFADAIGTDVQTMMEAGFSEDAFVIGERIGNERARVEWTDDGAKIVLTEAADVDSFLHEFSHVGRRLLPENMRKEFESLYGVEGEWTVKSEEQFADDFVRYIRDGYTPTKESKGIFQTLKDALTNLMRYLPDRINPEVKDAFDQLFTEKEKVETINFENGEGVLFQDGYDQYIKDAQNQGINIPDIVLAKGGTWAQKEYESRKSLVDNHKELFDDAKKAKNFTVFAENATKKSDLGPISLQRIYSSAHPSSRTDANSAFKKMYSAKNAIKELYQELKDGYPRVIKSRLDPEIRSLLETKEIIKEDEITDLNSDVAMTSADYDTLMIHAQEFPTTYREQLARARGDKAELKRMQTERDIEKLYADEATPQNRQRLVNETDDPKLINNILEGQESTESLAGNNKALKQIAQGLWNKLQAEKRNKAKSKAQKKKDMKALRDQLRENQIQQEINRKRAARLKKMFRKMNEDPPATVDAQAKKEAIAFRYKHFAGLKDIFSIHSKKNQDFWSEEYGVDQGMSREIKQMREKQVEELYAEYDQILKDGRRRKQMKDEDRRRRITAAQEEIIQDLSGKARETVTETDKKGNVKTRDETFQEMSDRVRKETTLAPAGTKERQKQDKGTAWTKALHYVARPPRMFRYFTGMGSKLYDLFVNDMNKAYDAELERIGKYKAMLSDIMAKNKIKNTDLSRKIKVGDSEFTINEAMAIYGYNKSGSGQTALLLGNGFTEAQLDAIDKALDQKYKSMMDELMQVYTEMAPDYAEAIESYTDNVFLFEDNYIPMARILDTTTELNSQLEEALTMQQKYQGIYVNNKNGLDRVKMEDEQPQIRLDALGTFNSYLNKTSHFITHGQLVRELQGVKKNSAIRKLMRQQFGKQAMEWIDKYTDDNASPHSYKAMGEMENASRMVRQNVALSALSLNAMSALKAGSSMLFFMTRVGPLAILKNLAMNVTSWNKTKEFINSRDPQMRERAISLEFEEARVQARNLTGRVQKIAELGMWMITQADALATRSGWMAVYEKEMASHGNEQMAIREAQRSVLETQPASATKDLPQFLRSNELLNWVFMFGGQVSQIANISLFDLPDAIKNGRNKEAIGTISALMSSWILMAVLSGWDPLESEDWTEEMSKAMIAQMIAAVPLFGSAIAQGVSGYSSGLELLPGVDDTGKLLTSVIDGDPDAMLKNFTNASLGISKMFGAPSVFAKRMLNVFTDEEMKEWTAWQKSLAVGGFKKKGD